MRFLYKWLCALFLLVLIAYSLWLIFNLSDTPLSPYLTSFNPNRAELVKSGFFAWLIFPPVAMFLDLAVFCRYFDLVDIELVKYSHESLRNIWLASIIGYVAIFGYGVIFVR